MENPTNPPAASKSGGDKQQVKRDEWNEGAVSSLLQAYEAKWVLRNRAKLKGQDWVDVARFVSTASGAPKTQTQCKNKIESMKKRYRSESASTSTWPMYEKIHHLLTGHNINNHAGGVGQILSLPQPINTNCSPLEAPSLVPFSVQIPTGQNQNAAPALKPNGVVLSPTKQEEDGAKLTQSDPARHDKSVTTDSSTSTNPAFNIRIGNKHRPSSSKISGKRKKKKSRQQSCGIVIAESVQWLAEAVVRTEEARMETMRELERMRAETEIRLGEMELKRTQIIADTQLEIARLMSGKAGQDTTPRFNLGRLERNEALTI